MPFYLFIYLLFWSTISLRERARDIGWVNIFNIQKKKKIHKRDNSIKLEQVEGGWWFCIQMSIIWNGDIEQVKY